jgi:hypothetical protein
MSDTRSPHASNLPADPADQGVLPVDSADVAKKEERPVPDPTRYGDWEKNGRCIDF